MNMDRTVEKQWKKDLVEMGVKAIIFIVIGTIMYLIIESMAGNYQYVTAESKDEVKDVVQASQVKSETVTVEKKQGVNPLMETTMKVKKGANTENVKICSDEKGIKKINDELVEGTNKKYPIKVIDTGRTKILYQYKDYKLNINDKAFVNEIMKKHNID